MLSFHTLFSRSILDPPEEPMELRKRPERAQDDILDPTRKTPGWKIGDRKKPPQLDFSLRHALFDEAAAMVRGMDVLWHKTRSL